MKQRIVVLLLVLVGSAYIFTACDDLFGSKQDSITDEIFRDGEQDPNLIVEDVGYVALLPFWTGFDNPTDVFVGYDELVYVTDNEGLHVLDRAGRNYSTIPLRGAVSVTQDRLLNVYVAARIDTVITAVDPNRVWDLPAVYKIRNANGAGPLEFIQTMVHPFMDASRSTTASQRGRLNDNPDSDENVEITGLATLANNDLYVTRRGPRNQTGQAVAQDNTVLLFARTTDSEGNLTDIMRNTSQIRTLNPNTPSLLSAIDVSAIASFATPPQRDNVPGERSFLIAQGNEDREIPFRVLWINAVQTPDGLEYRSNPQLLAQDTTLADSFLYEQDKFRSPSGIAFSGDERAHIFITDAATDSLYLFQSNGIEGVNPPAGSSATRAINVSFGGTGSGPREFRDPSGVAYFRRIVYVADTGNNRIARFRLNTDFE